uniref:CXC domain-containing protein n=1 Tax=Steinernema glaseri TaxID=37863 RepID=A0A1I7YVJ6_9BILA
MLGNGGEALDILPLYVKKNISPSAWHSLPLLLELRCTFRRSYRPISHDEDIFGAYWRANHESGASMILSILKKEDKVNERESIISVSPRNQTNPRTFFVRPLFVTLSEPQHDIVAMSGFPAPLILLAIAFCATFLPAVGSRRVARNVDINNVRILPTFAPQRRIHRIQRNDLAQVARLENGLYTTPPILKRCAVLKRKERRIKEIHDEVNDLLRQIKQVDLPHVKHLLPKSSQEVQALHRKLKIVLRKLSTLGRSVRESKHRKIQKCRLVKLEHKLGKAKAVNRKLKIAQPRTLPRNLVKMNSTKNEKERKLLVLNMSRNMSRNGNVGSYCDSHNECKPGLCCHRRKPHSVCVLHDLEEGAPCKHSCSCKARLQCFRSKTVGESAVCKKASADDVIHGVYENRKQAAPFEELVAARTRRRRR